MPSRPIGRNRASSLYSTRSRISRGCALELPSLFVPGAPDRLLDISQSELNALSFGFLIVLPLLLLLIGGLIAWRRRRR